MKTIYFIRHAKSKYFSYGESDYERPLKKKGYKDIQMIGSYLKLRGISPDIFLSSCALRAQESALELAKRIDYDGKIEYFQELYMSSNEEVIEILKAQDDALDMLFIMGHNPFLSELVNTLSREYISKIPTMGIVAVNFEEDSWSDIVQKKGDIDFFIFPKQFKYYVPNQIRAILPR
jgi:phosphohistidine phosphatase